MKATLSESFVSIQGEGPKAGRRCAFIRLGRCDLACTWCDTPYTWDWARYDPGKELAKVEVDELVGWLVGTGVDYLDITGGEPMLQRGVITELVTGAYALGIEVDIETNGRHMPARGTEFVHTFNVSPKLASSGNDAKRYVPEAIEALNRTGRALWKFVVCEESHDDDLAEIEGLVSRHDLRNIWIMPEGRTPEAVTAGLERLAPLCIEQGWHLTPRLQVLAFGDRRGT